ncbi:hypothetical protein [Novosphingobium sp. NBM11]|uniref:hypothetical protein n=1 Tax=Novosphingobium sp. NBM11 TaxID=2596914 RepID=UPI00189272FE|nr:hypothetical protein [Novosphingobium sp. NBM11]
MTMLAVSVSQPDIAVLAMARRSRFRPCAITLPQDRIAADIDTLPLWTWVRNRPAAINKGGKPRHGKPIVKHCISCGCVINRGSRGHCRPCGHIGLKREVPDDFRAVLLKLGSHGAARHFKASLSTVTRWRREISMSKHERAKRTSAGPRPFASGFQQRPLLCNRDVTVAGQAADFLRKFGAVYRCDADGKPNAKGSHWKRNFSVLTDDELMGRAERLGWSAVEM